MPSLAISFVRLSIGLELELELELKLELELELEHQLACHHHSRNTIYLPTLYALGTLLYSMSAGPCCV